MCKACSEAVTLNFPDVPEKDHGDFLVNFTCFPFGRADLVSHQLAELKRRSGGDVSRVPAIVDSDMHRCMRASQPFGYGLPGYEE